jgi:hypothetical protein
MRVVPRRHSRRLVCRDVGTRCRRTFRVSVAGPGRMALIMPGGHTVELDPMEVGPLRAALREAVLVAGNMSESTA